MISRKDKKLYVRQGFLPLFEMPIEIDHPERPLGTHVFTALEFRDGGAPVRWNVMSITNDDPADAAATPRSPLAPTSAMIAGQLAYFSSTSAVASSCFDEKWKYIAPLVSPLCSTMRSSRAPS